MVLNSKIVYDTHGYTRRAHKKALINSHMLHSLITVRVNKYTTDWA